MSGRAVRRALLQQEAPQHVVPNDYDYDYDPHVQEEGEGEEGASGPDPQDQEEEDEGRDQQRGGSHHHHHDDDRQQLQPPNPFALLDEEEEEVEEPEVVQPAATSGGRNAANKGGKTGKGGAAPRARKRRPKRGRPKRNAEQEEVERLMERLQLDTKGTAPLETGASGNDLARTNKVEVTDGGKIEEADLLTINPAYLNAELELCRLFGAKTVAAQRKESSNFRAKKGLLIHPNLAWPKFASDGVTMGLLRSDGDIQYFGMQWSPAYERLQEQYFVCVESSDPQTIAELLQFHPYHVDSLIQLALVCHHTNELETATDFIERAVYCFECCWHPLFLKHLMSGTCRVPFEHEPNRPFLLALFHYIGILGKRGCSRTALEYCKFLIALDPSDPFATHLLIDYFALRAKCYSFLPQFLQHYGNTLAGLTQGTSSESMLSGPAALPNFAFSLALSEFQLTGASGCALDLLVRALLLWPVALEPLLAKCSVRLSEKDSVGSWEEILRHKLFSSPIATPHKYLLTLYIAQAASLWKHNKVLVWLRQAAREAIKKVDTKEEYVYSLADIRGQLHAHYPGNLAGVFVHVLLSELGEAIAALPPEAPRTFQLYGPAVLSLAPPSSRPATQNPLALFVNTLLPWGQLPGAQPRPADGQPQAQAEWVQQLLALIRGQEQQQAEDD